MTATDRKVATLGALLAFVACIPAAAGIVRPGWPTPKRQGPPPSAPDTAHGGGGGRADAKATNTGSSPPRRGGTSSSDEALLSQLLARRDRIRTALAAGVPVSNPIGYEDAYKELYNLVTKEELLDSATAEPLCYFLKTFAAHAFVGARAKELRDLTQELEQRLRRVQVTVSNRSTQPVRVNFEHNVKPRSSKVRLEADWVDVCSAGSPGELIVEAAGEEIRLPYRTPRDGAERVQVSTRTLQLEWSSHASDSGQTSLTYTLVVDPLRKTR